MVNEKASSALTIKDAFLLMPSVLEQPKWSIDFDWSYKFTRLNTELINKLTDLLLSKKTMMPETGYSDSAMRKVFRPQVALITYVLTDRLLRLARFFEEYPADAVCLPKMPNFLAPAARNELLALSRDSWEFNQFILKMFLPQIEEIEIPGKTTEIIQPNIRTWDEYSGFHQDLLTKGAFGRFLKLIRKHNILGQTLQRFLENLTVSSKKNLRNPAGFIRELLSKIRFAIRRIFSLSGNIAVSSLGYNDKILFEEKFFAPKGRFSYLKRNFPSADFIPANKPLRKTLAQSLSKEIEAYFREFVSNFVNTPERIDFIFSNIANLFFQIFPKSSLEMLKKNCDLAFKRLRKFQNSHYISYDTAGEDAAVFYNFAATANGCKVWGIQHSAWGGYLANGPLIAEFSISGCDNYITSGWENEEKHLPVWENKAIPLPSPHYSEMKKNVQILGPRQKDNAKNKILLCIGEVYFFPTFYSSSLRLDNLKDWAVMLSDVISCLAKENITILLKLYSKISTEVIWPAIKIWQKAGGDYLTISSNYEKGSARNMFGEVNAVIWDVAGGGFVESVLHQKPAFVIWNDKLGKCQPEAEETIQGLISAGIFNQDAKSLAKNCKNLLNSENWWQEEQRQKALNNFMQRYIKTDENWRHIWGEFIGKQMSKNKRSQ